MHLESVLAVALQLRGAEVEFLLCDSALPACMACEIGFLGEISGKNSHRLSRAFCASCFDAAYLALKPLGIKIHRFSDYLSSEDFRNCSQLSHDLPLSRIKSFTHLGIPIGEHAFAGALRFYARGDLDDGVPFSENVQRQYLEAALLAAQATAKVLQNAEYHSVVFNHGIYVPQGIIGETCRRNHIAVVNWSAAYRKRCFIFSHHDTYHHTMITEPTSKWESMPWDADHERALMSYLDSRRIGSNDWIWFHERPLHDVGKALAAMGVDPGQPCIGMLTSVMWDAVLHYPSNAFANMLEWVFQTIDYFETRRDLQLIMRVHPAEIQGGLPSRQRVLDEIRRLRRGGIPRNVFIIPPESRLSTYALMEKCDAVTIFNTKTGIELAAMGIPVIVAGEAWIRNKGFSMDASSPEDYFRILDRLPFQRRMRSDDTLRARKYAYHFFFRRMIPLEFMEPTGGNPPFRINIKSIDELKSGRNRGLDLICDGILHGTEFIFDEPSP